MYLVGLMFLCAAANAIDSEVHNIVDYEESNDTRKYYGLSFNNRCKSYQRVFKCMSACKAMSYQVYRIDRRCKCTCHEMKTTTILPFFKWRTNGTTRAVPKTRSVRLYEIVGTIFPQPETETEPEPKNETNFTCPTFDFNFTMTTPAPSGNDTGEDGNKTESDGGKPDSEGGDNNGTKPDKGGDDTKKPDVGGDDTKKPDVEGDDTKKPEQVPKVTLEPLVVSVITKTGLVAETPIPFVCAECTLANAATDITCDGKPAAGVTFTVDTVKKEITLGTIAANGFNDAMSCVYMGKFTAGGTDLDTVVVAVIDNETGVKLTNPLARVPLSDKLANQEVVIEGTAAKWAIEKVTKNGVDLNPSNYVLEPEDQPLKLTIKFDKKDDSVIGFYQAVFKVGDDPVTKTVLEIKPSVTETKEK